VCRGRNVLAKVSIGKLLKMLPINYFPANYNFVKNRTNNSRIAFNLAAALSIEVELIWYPTHEST
jgi:hypothetical protein